MGVIIKLISGKPWNEIVHRESLTDSTATHCECNDNIWGFLEARQKSWARSSGLHVKLPLHLTTFRGIWDTQNLRENSMKGSNLERRSQGSKRNQLHLFSVSSFQGGPNILMLLCRTSRSRWLRQPTRLYFASFRRLIFPDARVVSPCSGCLSMMQGWLRWVFIWECARVSISIIGSISPLEHCASFCMALRQMNHSPLNKSRGYSIL